MNKENAEKILNQIATTNILDEYDKHLTENNLVLKGNILNEILNSKKLILKDTDLNFSQKTEYAYGNEFKTYELFVGKCSRKTFCRHPIWICF